MRGSPSRLLRPWVSGRACLALILGGVLAALVPAFAPPSSADTLHRQIDFETPGYGAPRRVLSDHFVLEAAGVWHLFYTELPGPLLNASRIGHASSPDLIHWVEHPPVILAGAAPWMATGTWAPHVIASPVGGWMMLFTGRSITGAQSIGALSSPDLETWTLAAPDSVFSPSPAWASWNSAVTSSCRDPFVWYENGAYSMIYTATTKNGRPAIGLARSPDLLVWSDAGPFAVDSTSSSPTDLESPWLDFGNGRVELIYSRYWVRYLAAETSAGPWDVAAGVTLDAQGIAPEKLRSGAVQMMSRVRQDPCVASTSVIVIDTVTVTAGGYTVPGPPGPPAGSRLVGDAFVAGPAWGDGPKRRGDPPAVPQGMRWLASGESDREPGTADGACITAEQFARRGSIRLPRFTLLGDSLWFRLMGAAAIDSAYVRLLDACTGLELARRTGPGTSALVSASWSNAGLRGWPVEIELVDGLDRPGGVIGLDAVLDSTTGFFVAPTPLGITQTAPGGGENLTPGQTYIVRWASFSSAGLDSHVVYVSYDNFATAPIRLQKRSANQFSWNWTVPTETHYDARIRVISYAKNGVHDCATSPSFSIGVTTGVPGDAVSGGLFLSVRGNPGPTPVLEWSGPSGGRAWLQLYDARGRRVRTLVDGESAGEGGRHLAWWDGRDEAGRNAPAGVFFAVLSGADGTRRHVTLVRLVR